VGAIGFTELLLLAVITLLVVGPKRLPEMARTLGQLSRTTRGAWQSLKSEFQAELDLEHNKKIMADSPELSPGEDDEHPPRQ
jgi:sec-independent protein translocase protein TatB